MTPAKLIKTISELGGRLYLDKGELRLKAPKGSLSDELLDELKLNKQELIDFLNAAKATEVKDDTTINRADRSKPLPASFSQQRLWFLEQLEPGKSIYNMPFSMRLRGSLNKQALQKALDDLVARHESLHTRFESDDDLPLQVIDDTLRIVIQDESIDASEVTVEQWLSTSAALTFDLQNGPLLRVHLLETDTNDHRLLLVMHHIISDAWSMSIIVQELARLYAAHCTGSDLALPPLDLQYADYAVWQRDWFEGPELERQTSYWIDQLGDAPPLLELPTDHPRPAVQSHAGDFLTATVDAPLTHQLRTTAQSLGVSMFMLLQAAFNILLARYSGIDDIVIGTPTAGRQRTELEPITGLFLNTLVLRNDLSGNPPFAALVDQIRRTTLASYEHQDLPFEKLVEELRHERHLSYSPVFQILFNLRAQSSHVTKLHELDVDFDAISRTTAMFDLNLSVDEAADSLALEFEFNTDLFERSTIERMSRHFESLLEGIVADPQCGIRDLPLLGPEERHTLLVDWNNTTFDYPQELTMHAMVEQQAAAQPDAIALWTEAEELSYAELNRRANRLAATLQAAGAGPGSLVGISSERTSHLIVGLLGILKSGAAYVPLDPNYPPDRVSFMIEDSQAPIVLTLTEIKSRLPETAAQVVCLDTFDWGSMDEGAGNPDSGAQPADLGYVIYTSGSTGKPKGVAIEHRNAVALMQWAGDVFAPEEITGVLASTSVCFDLSVFEIFCTLGNGGRIVLVQNALSLLDLPEQAEVSLINTVPSAIEELVSSNGIPESVRTVNLAGEPLPTALADKVYGTGSVSSVNDLYGPSEDTTYSTWTRREPGEAPTIGRPVHNTQVYLLDAWGQPVPTGAIGELYLGGRGVTREYLHRPELTAEKYVPDHFGTDPAARLYRTGDQARYRPDGKLEFLGRIDQQVKLRGFRIELGEIEAILHSHSQVHHAYVMVREDTPGDKRLIAYLVAEPEQIVNEAVLRSHIKRQLPDYMIPSAFVELDQMPLTPNGKVDRENLPAPGGKRGPVEASQEPDSALQKTLADIWKKLLKVEHVGVDDNFFDLGGHSLLTIKLMRQIEAITGEHLTIADIFENPTVRELGALLPEADWNEPATGNDGLLAKAWRKVTGG